MFKVSGRKADMNDLELDQQLGLSNPSTGIGAAAERDLGILVLRTRASEPRRQIPVWARLTLIAGAGLTAVSLLAGVGYQQYLLSRSPFVGLDPGEQRTTKGLVVSQAYGPDAGERCVLYPEFLNLTTQQFTAMESYVEATKSWPDFSALTAQSAGITAASPEDDASLEATYSAAELQLTHDRLAEVVPGLTLQQGKANGMPSLEGYSMLCTQAALDSQ